MAKQYKEYVENNKETWVSIANILDFEGEEDLDGTPDRELARDAVKNLRDLANEALEKAGELTTRFLA